MKSGNVEISTRMNLLLQTACRTLRKGLIGLVLTLPGGLGGVSVAWSAAPVGPTLAQAQLVDTMQIWLARQRGVAPTDVSLGPFDSRLKVPACKSGWRFDTPFAPPQPGARETVRARCMQPKAQLYLSARVVAAAELHRVLVLKNSQLRGTRLDPAMLEFVEMDIGRAPQQALENPDLVLDAELVRDVRGGEPLRSYDIRPTVLVKRGQMVLLSLGHGQGFTITARVEALQDGRRGETIRLKNRESGRLLSGVVTGQNTVSAP